MCTCGDFRKTETYKKETENMSPEEKEKFEEIVGVYAQFMDRDFTSKFKTLQINCTDNESEYASMMLPIGITIKVKDKASKEAIAKAFDENDIEIVSDHEHNVVRYSLTQERQWTGVRPDLEFGIFQSTESFKKVIQVADKIQVTYNLFNEAPDFIRKTLGF